MRVRLSLSFCVCAAVLASVAAQGASAKALSIPSRPAVLPPLGAKLGPPRTAALPLKGVSASQLNALIAAGTTVKVWSSSITSPLNSQTYKYKMVGKSPLVTETNPSTSIPADVIPVSLKFDDSGHVFNPTKTDPSCLPNSTATADSLLLASPVYKAHAYSPGGINIGTVQYLDGFQRENFAKYIIGSTAKNPGYHVKLSPVTNHAKISVEVGLSAGVTEHSTAGCKAPVGVLDIGAWDNFVQTQLLPSLKSSVTPQHFPLFLFYNVVMSNGGQCCILGYHSAYASPSFGGAVQTYSTSDYESSGAFANTPDISALSHEVGEWMDDPFVKNATPAWGHIGQVPGCQSNLEVGDPLTGTNVKVKMSNGITYHPQELAFRDWFYRTKSIGLNGWYSSRGTFTSNAGSLCS